MMKQLFQSRLAIIRRAVLALALLGVGIVILTGCDGASGGGGGGGGGGNPDDAHDFGNNNTNLVLVVGDAITAGGFSGGLSWPVRFSNMSGKDVVIDASGNDTAFTGAGRIDRLLANHKPGYVLILYGAYDAIQGVNPDSTAFALDHIRTASRNNKSIPMIGTVTPMAAGFGGFNAGVNEINARIRNSGAGSARIVDLHSVMSGAPSNYLAADGLHLNDTGELAAAMEFADEFD